jgi:hypothetical protein
MEDGSINEAESQNVIINNIAENGSNINSNDLNQNIEDKSEENIQISTENETI